MSDFGDDYPPFVKRQTTTCSSNIKKRTIVCKKITRVCSEISSTISQTTHTKTSRFLIKIKKPRRKREENTRKIEKTCLILADTQTKRIYFIFRI